LGHSCDIPLERRGVMAGKRGFHGCIPLPGEKVSYWERRRSTERREAGIEYTCQVCCKGMDSRIEFRARFERSGFTREADQVRDGSLESRDRYSVMPDA